MIEHVQTRTEIKAVLERFGVRPRKRHGQHFLIDGNLMRRLAAAAELTPEDIVLEIGPGTGGLTDLLVAVAKRVIAVEIDAAMQAILRERFAGRGSFELIAADVLANRNRLADPVLRSLQASAPEERRHLKMVANLPYNVAAPILVNLLLLGSPISKEMSVLSAGGTVPEPSARKVPGPCSEPPAPVPVLYCFTVQKEVADRFLAGPRTKAYGPLSILFQALCDIRPLAVLPPAAFWPEPQVASTMLRLAPAEPPLYTGDAPAAFMALVRAGFASRRKTLRFNLRKYVGEAGVQELEARLELDRRAEELSVAEWVALDHLVADKVKPPIGD